MQRLNLLWLQQYIRDVEIKYRSGKEMYLARVFLQNNHSHRSEAAREVESTVHVVDYISSYLQEAARRDSERHIGRPNSSSSTCMQKTNLEGWPDSKATVPIEAREYYGIRDELTVQDERAEVYHSSTEPTTEDQRTTAQFPCRNTRMSKKSSRRKLYSISSRNE